MLRNLYCTGQIQSTGNSSIIDRGFCYSTTESYPTIENSNRWSVPGSGTYFYSTITGLTQATYYYINSYAINEIGIDYSDPEDTMYVRTLGISVYPTITCNITYNGLNIDLFEMGTTNAFVVSGVINKNDEDESNFSNGYLNQISSPKANNPIKTWTGYVSTYSTNNPPINVNFVPTSSDIESWTMTQTAYYNIVGPESYQINGTDNVSSVFPILWILKDSFQSLETYYNPVSQTFDYFYYQCSSNPNPTKPKNGKIIINKEDFTFQMSVESSSNSYFHLACPVGYGNFTFNVNGGLYIANPNYSNYLVGTGYYGNQFGIINQWMYNNNLGWPYKILKYHFTSYSPTPVTIGVRFL